MTHTRRGSAGLAKTKENAHPFEVENIIFTHNGTIDDKHNWAKNHGFDWSKWDSDTKLLASILQISGVEAFIDYTGTAACAWFDKSDSSLYLWKGAHRLYPDSEVLEERPLYYFVEDDGVYYCSIKDSLFLIGGTDDNVKTVPNNTLLQFTNGELVNETVLSHDYYEKERPKVYKGSGGGTYNLFKVSPKNTITSKIVVDGQLYIKDDLYYVNYFKLENGIHKVNDLGQLSKDGHEIYCFEGYLLKSREVYDKWVSQNITIHMIRNSRFNDFLLDLLPHTLIRNGHKYYYMNSARVDGDVHPIYSNYRYTMLDGKFKASKLITREKKKKKKDINMEFNQNYGLLLTQIATIEKSVANDHESLTDDNKLKLEKLWLAKEALLSDTKVHDKLLEAVDKQMV